MYLTSSIALLLIKMVVGYFGLLGAWNITNLVLDILSDKRLIHNHSYHFFNSKFIIFFKSLHSKYILVSFANKSINSNLQRGQTDNIEHRTEPVSH